MQPQPTGRVLAQLEAELKEIYTEVAVLAAAQALRQTNFDRVPIHLQATFAKAEQIEKLVQEIEGDVRLMSEGIPAQIGDILSSLDSLGTKTSAPRPLDEAALTLLKEAATQAAAAREATSLQGEVASGSLAALAYELQSARHELKQLAHQSQKTDLDGESARQRFTALATEIDSFKGALKRSERLLHGAIGFGIVILALLVYMLLR